VVPVPEPDPVIDPLLSRALAAQRSEDAACPDAEEIAAWAEQTLAPLETARLEAHLSSCVRCQAVVGTLVQTTPVEIARPESLWKRWRLAWLVPVAGTAAAVGIYVATGPTPSSPPPASAPQASAAKAEDRVAREANPTSTDRASSAEVRIEQQAATLEPSRADNQPQADNVQRRAQVLAAPAGAAESTVAARRVEVRSAVTNERWRIGSSDGQVEFSSDAGMSWQPDASSVSVGILAGSAPAARVCWLVGSGGAVWLTTDAVRFTRVSFPQPLDLLAVTATSARAATVTSADGRSFRTDDQGATWQPVP
jgi:hypothetical protein